MMKHHAHPGLLVKHDCIGKLGLGVQEAADVLGVHCSTVSHIINGKSSISPDMAICLVQVFGGTAERWLRMQFMYNVVHLPEKAGQVTLSRWSKDHVTNN